MVSVRRLLLAGSVTHFCACAASMSDDFVTGVYARGRRTPATKRATKTMPAIIARRSWAGVMRAPPLGWSVRRGHAPTTTACRGTCRTRTRARAQHLRPARRPRAALSLSPHARTHARAQHLRPACQTRAHLSLSPRTRTHAQHLDPLRAARVERTGAR